MNRRSKERVILDATPIRDVAYTLDDALIASATGLARQDNGSWIVTGPDPGILQTVPLHGSGDHLLVRAGLANTSDLRVALLGVDGCVMENFDDDTTTVTGACDDWFNVHWFTDRLRGRTLIMNNAESLVVLRFTLARGTLHAFRITDTWHTASAPAADDPEPLELSCHPQLFLDDHLVAQRTNLQRDLRQPEKHPDNPVMVAEHPWEMYYMQTSSVVHDPEDNCFRAWYGAKPTRNSTDPKFCDCYAESPDGLRWTKPMIGKAPVGPWETNNALGLHKAPRSVFLDTDDPDPARRFKAAGGATSPDGLNWSLSEDDRALWYAAVGKNDTVTSFVRWKDEYLNYVRYQGPETNAIVHDPRHDKTWLNSVYRATGLSTSADFRHWTAKEQIFATDERDGYPWTQPHALCVTAYGDVLVGLLPLLHLVPEDGNNFLGSFDVQLMVSRDGRKWDRVADRAVFMPCMPHLPLGARAWDYCFHPTCNFFVKDDRVWIYYFGMPFVHGENRKNHVGIGALASTRHFGAAELYKGLGLATLPADRFVALHPASYTLEGVLDTKPFIVAGNRLLVNADLPHGRMEVALLDAKGDEVPGFERASSALTVCDPLRHEVVWKQEDGTTRTLRDAPKGTPLAFRFVVINGDFYAFQVVE